MTALQLPRSRPGVGLTVAEYEALGDGEEYRNLELQEGQLVMTPTATAGHNMAMGNLYEELKRQSPRDVVVLQVTDVNLQLAPPEGPGTVRAPDVLVVDRAEFDRVHAEGGSLRAAGVRLVVEILSPGSKRTDRIIKRAEYADAGIGHYWIVDLEKPISLVAHHLGGEFGYVDDGEVTGTFTTTQPYPLTIDLDSLL